MTKLELPAEETVKVFGGVRKMAARTGRAPSTISSAKNSESGFFPHWWTRDLIELAAREGIKLPKAKPMKRTRRAV
jgi:hypothetical protein